ncbi:Glutathione synthetase [Larimichthys crocea]|uniref:Uncharacterized protein n=1 Tax=Larimichthys crocea TaxID=215358 RepID=A0ACD3RA67_LARCR|nr:Glutathione synthetase [Larimichthys crocea]
MERSLAVKCPDISTHLAGTKKVQQVLAKPGVLEKFFPGQPQIVEQIRATFTGLYTLDMGPEGDQAVAMALAIPDKFVLKPQREGGGNNYFGEDIVRVLQEVKSEKRRAAYILMDRIRPRTDLNVLLRRGLPLKITSVCCELGICGAYVSDNEEEVVEENEDTPPPQEEEDEQQQLNGQLVVRVQYPGQKQQAEICLHFQLGHISPSRLELLSPPSETAAGEKGTPAAGPVSVMEENEEYGPDSVKEENEEYGPVSVKEENEEYGPDSVKEENEEYGPDSVKEENEEYGPVSVMEENETEYILYIEPVPTSSLSQSPSTSSASLLPPGIPPVSLTPLLSSQPPPHTPVSPLPPSNFSAPLCTSIQQPPSSPPGSDVTTLPKPKKWKIKESSQHCTRKLFLYESVEDRRVLMKPAQNNAQLYASPPQVTELALQVPSSTCSSPTILPLSVTASPHQGHGGAGAYPS